MDVLYRGLETALLICAFVLSAAAVTMPSTPPYARPALQGSVTLPMLTVVADGKSS